MQQQQQQCQFDQMMAKCMAQHNNNTTGQVLTNTTGTTAMAMAPQHSPRCKEHKKKKQAQETIESDEEEEEEDFDDFDFPRNRHELEDGQDDNLINEQPAFQDSNAISNTDQTQHCHCCHSHCQSPQHWLQNPIVH